MPSDFIVYLYIIPCALIAIIFHELAHGLVSVWLGDPTPKEDGRLSLNPLKHIDPFGLICLIFFRFGWAKPVMINSSYYKNPKWGTALVSLAGPIMNFLLAIISSLFVVLIYNHGNPNSVMMEVLFNFFMYLAIINIGLGLFNLIPIPPLDGSKVIGAFLPDSAYEQYMKYQKYGFVFLFAILILLDVLEMMGYPSILNEILSWGYSLLYRFWGLFIK